MPIAAAPLTIHVGIEINVDSGLPFADESNADECLGALERYGVVVYRAANISDEDLVAFSRLLGEVVVSPTREHQYPEIATITLDPGKANAVLAWYRQGNFQWHVDGATEQLPQKATLLLAREVDESGGDTEFASTYAAYEALSKTTKSEIADLAVIHSFATAQLRAHPGASKDERARWAAIPTRVHPLVWTHRNGRKSLLIGATAAEVVGWPAIRSTALLNQLLEWSTQPEFVLRHKWNRGDLVVWDNTGMLHRACTFEPTSRRLMHRTTLVGVESVVTC